jgi:hypothetical protein
MKIDSLCYPFKPAARRLTASPAESEAPGTEINSPIPAPTQKKTVNKHDFHRICLQSEFDLSIRSNYLECI